VREYFLQFSPEAFKEAENATRYYEQICAGLGVRFRQELEVVTRAITEQPLLWRERRVGFRRVNLPNFPFYVAYFLRGEKILVAAVAHASRHPDYWKMRA
jgi:plasmid stabilization system protein ParE